MILEASQEMGSDSRPTALTWLLWGRLLCGSKSPTEQQQSPAAGSHSWTLLRDTPLRSKRPLPDCQHPVLSYLETVSEALNKDLLFLVFKKCIKVINP